MRDNSYLIDFYSHYDEEGRLASRHGSVEFLTTMRYIEKYLKPGSRILEIGAGTGRYSHSLARRGFLVDAVELVEHNIEVFQSKTLPGEPVSIRQGNALDLSGFSDHQYDITLLLGPRTSAGPSAKPSGLPGRAASFLRLTSSPTAACWTKGFTGEISMWPSISGTA